MIGYNMQIFTSCANKGQNKAISLVNHMKSTSSHWL